MGPARPERCLVPFIQVMDKWTLWGFSPVRVHKGRAPRGPPGGCPALSMQKGIHLRFSQVGLPKAR